MYSINSYKDLVKEIEILQIRIEGIQEQKRLLEEHMNKMDGAPKPLKAMIYTDMPKGGAAIDYAILIEAHNKLDNLLYIEDRILKGMKDTQEKINAKLKEFEGIEYKVAYLTQVEGKTLQEVADELDYSLGYIQNLSAKINRR